MGKGVGVGGKDQCQPQVKNDLILPLGSSMSTPH